MTSSRKTPIVLLTVIGLVAVDQLSKYWVVEAMNLKEIGTIEAGPFLTLRMAWNYGINFGLFGGDSALSGKVMASILSLVGIVIFVMALRSKVMKTAVGLAVMAGGAFGNIIDRFNYGAVADFINLSCCGVENPWSFNVADIAVFAGLAILIWPEKKPAT